MLNGRRKVCAVAVVSTALFISGCQTSSTRAEFGDPSDACAAQREPLIQLSDDFNKTLASYAAAGAIGGVLLTIATQGGNASLSDVGLGVLIGGLAGASAGYIRAKHREGQTREELLASVDQDASGYRGRSSALRNSISALHNCRARQIAAVSDGFKAGLITKEQAASQIDAIELSMSEDDRLLNQVLGSADARVSELAEARAAVAGYSGRDAYLGDVATWQPAVEWRNPDGTFAPSSQNASVIRTMYSTGSVNIRQRPTTSSPTVASLKTGDEVNVVGVPDAAPDWFAIEVNNTKGFVLGRLLSDQAPVARTAQPAAQPVIGTPGLQSASVVVNRPTPADETQAMYIQQKETRAVHEAEKEQLDLTLANLKDLVG